VGKWRSLRDERRCLYLLPLTKAHGLHQPVGGDKKTDEYRTDRSTRQRFRALHRSS
jgi:hypothetical protein